jgi:hypothetical protein
MRDHLLVLLPPDVTLLQAAGFVAFVWGATFALFRSWPVQELRAWYTRRRTTQRPRTQEARIGRLQWELRTRREWSPAAEAGDPFTAARELNPPELSARAAELNHLAGNTRLRRAMAYWWGCWFCQTAAVAAITLLATGHGVLALPASVAAAALCAWLGEPGSPHSAGKRGGCSCENR